MIGAVCVCVCYVYRDDCCVDLPLITLHLLYRWCNTGV